MDARGWVLKPANARFPAAPMDVGSGVLGGAKLPIRPLIGSGLAERCACAKCVGDGLELMSDWVRVGGAAEAGCSVGPLR